LYKEFVSRTPEELFQEFKLKIEFLPGEPYKHLRRAICDKIGVSTENLNHYLSRKSPVSREKLEDMLYKLNKWYGAAFLRKEFLPDVLKPYAHDEAALQVESTSTYDSFALELKAFKELFFEVVSRLDGKDIEELHKQFLHMKEEIARRPAD
jgi:hypothetical protein